MGIFKCFPLGPEIHYSRISKILWVGGFRGDGWKTGMAFSLRAAAQKLE